MWIPWQMEIQPSLSLQLATTIQRVLYIVSLTHHTTLSSAGLLAYTSTSHSHTSLPSNATRFNAFKVRCPCKFHAHVCQNVMYMPRILCLNLSCTSAHLIQVQVHLLSFYHRKRKKSDVHYVKTCMYVCTSPLNLRAVREHNASRIRNQSTA